MKANDGASLRVLFVIDYFDERFPRDQVLLARFLADSGVQVHVLTCNRDEDGRRLSRAYAGHTPNLHVSRRRSFRLKIPRRYAWRLFFPSTNFRPDIVHAFGFGSFSSFAGWFLARRHGVPLVMRSDINANGIAALENSAIYRGLLAPLRASHHVYTFSPDEREALVRHGIDRSATSYVGVGFNGANLVDMPFDPAIRAVGFLGRIEALKGADRLPPSLDVAYACGARVVIAGPDNGDSGAEPLRAWLRAHPDAKVLGLVAGPHEVLRRCSIFLAPTRLESGAIAVLEAMAAGRVVIASRISPITDYIQDGISGFLVDDWAAEAPHLVRALLEDPDKLQAISHAARTAARAHDFVTIGPRIRGIYAAALAPKSG